MKTNPRDPRDPRDKTKYIVKERSKTEYIIYFEDILIGVCPNFTQAFHLCNLANMALNLPKFEEYNRHFVESFL